MEVKLAPTVTNNQTTMQTAPAANGLARDKKTGSFAWSWDTGFIAGLILLVVAWVGIELGMIPARARDTVATFTVLVGVSATVAAATRSLPAQNVWLATVVIVLIGTGVLAVDAVFGIPFGQMCYMDSAGQRVFGLVPWPMPFVCVVVVLNARGVARLIMRPWRKARNYGFWVMGIAAGLAALFDLGLEVFASRLSKFWLWQTRPTLPTWHGAPFISLFGWAMATLLILGFATPLLVNKSSGGQHHRTGVQPLVIWLVLNGLFAGAACVHGLWLGAAVIAVANLAVTVLAVRGAMW